MYTHTDHNKGLVNPGSDADLQLQPNNMESNCSFVPDPIVKDVFA